MQPDQTPLTFEFNVTYKSCCSGLVSVCLYYLYCCVLICAIKSTHDSNLCILAFKNGRNCILLDKESSMSITAAISHHTKLYLTPR